MPMTRSSVTRVLLAVPVLACVSVIAAGQASTLTASQAADHLGKQATVCGKVASGRYAQSARGQPTFLNLDAPYPNPVFTIVIWRDSREKFGAVEEKYRDKAICVTGKITSYRGEAQIVATDPKQISLKR